MKLIFFCGHRSPYGLAHLKPILESNFEVIALVLATDERWMHFRSALSGKPIEFFKQHVQKFGPKDAVKHIVAGLPGDFDLKKRALKSIHPDHYLEKEIVQHLKKHSGILKYEFNINSDAFLTWVYSLEPDLIISAAYPQIFKKPLLQTPLIGCVNSHPSLLPRCRGAHPVFWAIATGERRSGVTAHYMTELLDNGDIIAQRGFDLEPNIRYKELYSRVVNEVPELVNEVQGFFFSGKRDGIPQNDTKATYFRNDRDIHRRIFFSKQTAIEIDRLVRACDGGASFFYRGEFIQLTQTHPSRTNRNLTNSVKVPPGTVVDLEERGPCITTLEGIIQLSEIHAGSEKIQGTDISKRLGWQIGMVIGS
jgi:methionyl-tRNA formyltransferase